MRAGGGKSKGSAWERVVCKALSLWLTRGRDEGVFWRSSMSGGRATVHRRKGSKAADAACGDICALKSIGHRFLRRFFIECKATTNLMLDAYLGKELKGKKDDHWLKPCRQAKEWKKEPWVIVKRNKMEPLVYVQRETRDRFNKWAGESMGEGYVPRHVGYFPLYRLYVYPLAHLLDALNPDWLKT